MRVLVVGAHPDDAEFYCGGTIAKCVNRGDDVYIAVVTDGSRGSDTNEKEATATRHAEATAAAGLVGAKLIWLGLRDASLLYTEENRLKIVGAFREANPDVVLTHSPDDYHPDHVNTGRMASDASILGSLKLIDSPYPPMSTVPCVYYMDHCTGVGFNPDTYVDITDTFNTKQEMLRCHNSQVSWLQEQFGMSVLDDVEIMSKFRGMQCRKAYAEGFVQMKAYPRIGAQRLQP